LLDLANQALEQGAYDEALALVDRHAVEHPRSALGDVREAIAVRVACRSGRLDAGRRRAEVALRTHAHSLPLQAALASCREA
jgi:hypothetical protein